VTNPIIFDLTKLAPAIREQIEQGKYRDWFTRKPTKLLGMDGDAKTIKGNKKGFKTAILYLAPANISGEQLCPLARLAQCEAPCLFTAGRGAMSTVMLSRLWKTLFFQQYREEFLALLAKEIKAYEAKAAKEDFELLVRLNGTSDIRWENYGIIQAFPNVTFYDYSKIINRKNIPSNYDLTFSYSGVPGFASFNQKAVEAGMRIAVVFESRKVAEHYMEHGFMGLPTVDGDDTDIRHLDPKGAVVALYAKGKAKKDTSGFVVRLAA